MNEEKAKEEIEKTISPVIGFILIGDIMGVNYLDSGNYFLLKYAEGNMKYYNQKIEYTNGIEYAERIYPNEDNIIITDELFDLTVHKVKNKEGSFKVELTVNTDGDFSKTKEYIEYYNENKTDILQNWQAELENVIEEEKNLLNNVGTDKKDNNITDTKNNNTANIEKIPQTGNEISLQKILYSVIAIAVLLGVCLAIYSKKTSK